MSNAQLTLTVGWIGRHTPPGAGAGGRDAAILDIAQDLLLRDLNERGALDAVVFKGGTALRKLYAGHQGRFSLDLDFSLLDVDADPDTVVLELVAQIDQTRIGPFSFGVTERRGKWSLTVASPFGSDETELSSKIDVSPPVWLDPVQRGWIPMPVHTARDMDDLAWIVEHQREVGGPDTGLVRRLAVLKIRVDARGVSAHSTQWKPGHEPRPFDPGNWLRARTAAEFDLEDIGAPAVPVPDASSLSATISRRYAFLAQLDADERRLATAQEQDRPVALRLLAELPDTRLAEVGLF